MTAVPMTQKQANEFIEKNHRHHGRVQGDIFRIGAQDTEGNIVGVMTVGRPVARGLQDGATVEVTRLCTTGQENACSFLYSRAARVAKELGYKRIITYTLENENGVSLRASGWTMTGLTDGGTWNRPNRVREDKAPTCPKQRWERRLEASE